MKKALRKVVPSLFDYSPQGLNFNKPTFKAVIYSIDRIGDAIACSIAINAIREKRNDAEIIIVCSRYNYEIFKQDPQLKCYKIKNDSDFFSIIKTCLKIKEHHGEIDLLFSPTTGNKNTKNVFMGLLKSNCNIVTEKSKLRMHHYQQQPDNNTSIFESYQRELINHGFNAKKKVSFCTDISAKKRKDDFLSERNICKYIAVNFDAFEKRRCLPSSLIKKLQILLPDNNLPYIIVAPSDKTHVYIEKYGNDKNVLVYDRIKSIQDSAAVIEGADLLLTPDTALVHIASAFNIPTIVVYRDEFNAKYWPSLSKHHKAIIMNNDLDTCDTDDLTKNIAKAFKEITDEIEL